jgi:hypothetical protein
MVLNEITQGIVWSSTLISSYFTLAFYSKQNTFFTVVYKCMMIILTLLSITIIYLYYHDKHQKIITSFFKINRDTFLIISMVITIVIVGLNFHLRKSGLNYLKNKDKDTDDKDTD